MEQVARHLHALRHPVQPDGPGIAAAVDVVVGDDAVQEAVELDAGHLRARPTGAEVDVVDLVPLDPAERATEAADDAVLSAVMYPVVTDDVAADFRLRPSVLLLGVLDGVVVAFGGAALAVPLVGVLTERDAGAARVVDFVVLNDPALVPVGGDEADLSHGGRRPVCGGVAQVEPAYGDVVDGGLFRREDGG